MWAVDNRSLSKIKIIIEIYERRGLSLKGIFLSKTLAGTGPLFFRFVYKCEI